MIQFERTRPYDVGILLVHGIGQQRKGDTLVECGGPLVDCLEARLASVARRVRRGSARSCCVDMQGVRIHQADRENPAHAEIKLSNIDGLRQPGSPFEGDPTSRWILAESWWAEAFPSTTYLKIFQWMIRTLPVGLVSHFERRVRTTFFEIRNPDNLANPMGKYFRMVRDIASLMLAIVVVPPVLCVLILVLLIGFLPIPFMGSFAQWLQRILAATVGDSYVLLDKRLSRSSIVETVRRDIGWLAQRCEKIVVVAHSQGAAIAHEVVQSDPLLECDHLITYGSGLQKLAQLEQLEGHGNTALLWIAVLCFFLASLSGLLTLLSLKHIGTLVFTGCIFLTVACLALGRWLYTTKKFFSRQAQWKEDQQLFARRFRFLNDRVRWTDVYASADPIPNGPLLDEYRPIELETYVTWNEGSLLRDHITYWQNRDDFVSRLARLLLDVSGINVRTLDRDENHRQDAATTRRRWRVGWRRLGHWVALGVAAALAFRLWTDPPNLTENIVVFLGELVKNIPLVGTYLVQSNAPAFHSPLGISVFLVILGVVSALNWWVWELWNRAEVATFFQRRSYSFRTPSFIVYMLSLFAMLVPATIYSFGPSAFYVWMILMAVTVALLLSDKLEWTSFLEGIQVRAANGSLDQVWTRQHEWDLKSLVVNAEKGRRWSLYLMGRRQIESQSEVERTRGEQALLTAAKSGEVSAARQLGTYLEDVKKDYKGAKEAYETGKKLGDPWCAYLLGSLLEKKFNDEEAAIEAYSDAAFQLSQRNASHSLGYLLQRRRQKGWIGEVLRAFKKGVELNDGLSAYWLGDLYCEQAEKREKRGHLKTPAILYRVAIDLYRQAIDLGYDEAATRLGELLQRRNDVHGAIVAFKSGVRLRSGKSALELGKLLKEENRLDEAQESLRRALELEKFTNRGADAKHPTEVSPTTVDAAWELGQLLEACGHVNGAHRLYRMAMGESGQKVGRSEAALRLGKSLLKTGDKTNAEGAFRRGLELDSAKAGIYLGKLLDERGKNDEALNAFREAAAAEKEWPLTSEVGEAAVSLGLCLVQRGMFEEAKTAYQNGVERGSQEAELRLVNLLVSDSDDMMAQNLSASRWRWHSAVAGLRLARFLMEGGYKEAAEKVLNALRWDKHFDDVDIALDAGRLFDELGDKESAILVFQRTMNRGSGEAAHRLGKLLKDAADGFGSEHAFRRARVLGYAAAPESSSSRQDPSVPKTAE